jgi:hypothetical protein
MFIFPTEKTHGSGDERKQGVVGREEELETKNI